MVDTALQSGCPWTWSERGWITDPGAKRLAGTPTTGHEALIVCSKQLLVDLVQHRGVLTELPGKGGAASDHHCCVVEGDRTRMLSGRIIPGNEVHVVVYDRVRKLWSVAYNCLEIAFG